VIDVLPLGGTVVWNADWSRLPPVTSSRIALEADWPAVLLTVTVSPDDAVLAVTW
jgi:hypothetical protein